MVLGWVSCLSEVQKTPCRPPGKNEKLAQGLGCCPWGNVKWFDTVKLEGEQF